MTIALLLAALPLAAQRDTVLRQVRLPLSYYWLEMYVPQVTSGPSAVTWSPDGRELIYSMQGTLWRQAVGDTEATQITDGPGYDFQPDWSPDGAKVAFARWAGDTIELQVLDLANGAVAALTSNGALNLEPRWSPDGTRLAFVSSAYNGRWHLFVVPAAGGTPQRLTEDHDSGPRRYYSRWDHYLSPTWSPDGKELVFVSNRGHYHGTGGLWRMAADSTGWGAMRELRYEETNWKARPDWSPDGHRVVYSSYLGRQSNQLWLLAAEGGDPVQLTYGEFDATAPRWSPDGSRIAFISNETGNTSLWVLGLPGGRRTTVDPRVRHYLNPNARVRLVVRDQVTGTPLAARVRVTGPDGRAYAPDDAWRLADIAFDRTVRSGPDRYFDVDGSARLTLPAGVFSIDVTRGPEYRPVHREVTIVAGKADSVRVSLSRLANLPAQGWWSGDLHVHMNYGGTYRNTPAHLVLQARAEDLHLVENLVVNKEQRIPDIAYPPGRDPASIRDYQVFHAQEFHTGFWDHVGLLNLRDHYLLPDYAGYPNTALASLYPPNAIVADLAHAQGGMVGYVHPFDSLPDPFDTTHALSLELPVDVALGKVDYLEVMGFSNHLFTSTVWYRLLNCGFRIPAGAGTDAFANFAMLRGPVGLERVYVHTGPGGLDHTRFLAGLKAGRTFVTNGPLITLTVQGIDPGDELQLTHATRLSIHVVLKSIVPVDHLELIGNGQVVASLPLAGERTSADTTFEVPVDRSGWLVLRAWGDGPRDPVLDMYPFASTSPVYITVGDTPVRSHDDALFFVQWIDRVDQAAEAHAGWNSTAERDAVRALLARARAVYAEKAEE